MAERPLLSQGLLIIETLMIILRHTALGRTSGRMISTVPHNTQHSEETEISALGGIRTRSPNRQAAAGIDWLYLPIFSSTNPRCWMT
jgi:hypothetical protein